MAQISKRWLAPEVTSKIRGLLVDCIARCSSQSTAANFIDVLLTDTEKSMIAKRIAIALLLVKGYTAPEIDEKLKVSLGTIYSVRTWLQEKGKEYQKLLEEIAKEDAAKTEKRQQLVSEAQSFFSLRPGTSWKEQRRKQWEDVRKEKVPF